LGLDIVRVQSGQYAGQARISKCGRALLRWACYHAAVGAARTVAGRTRLAALKAKRRGDRFAGFKAVVELAAKQLRVIWGVWRSGTPYDPTRAGGLQRQRR
jgi:transposase